MSRHYAPASQETRDIQMKKYDEFCNEFEGVIKPYPCDSAQVCLYITHMTKTLKYRSIRNYVSALNNDLQLRGHPQVVYEDYNIRRCFAGARRTLGDKVKQAEALLPKNIVLLLSKLSESRGHVSFRAALLTCFRGLLRKAHVTVSSASLRRQDITFHSWGMMIHVDRSKTIQFAERTVDIPVANSSNRSMCAVYWTRRHFTELPAGPGDQAFRVPAGGGGSAPLEYRDYHNTLKLACERSKLDPEQYSSHSLRRGGATFLLMIGVSIAEVKVRGDWKSDAVFEYLKVPLAHRIANDIKVAGLLSECVL